MNKNLKNMLNDNLCVGCGLCSSMYPEYFGLVLSKQGFYRAVLRNSPTNEVIGKLMKSCPAFVGRPSFSTDFELLKTQPLSFFGYSKRILIGYSTNQKLRYSASSGGALSAVLSMLLSEKKIDAVIHIGVSDNDPLLNEVKISRNIQEVFQFSGSRYAPAATLSKIKEVLESKMRFAFVGKPCEVAALRSFISSDHSFDNKIVSYLSFFCAGTPSMRTVEKIPRLLGIDREKIKDIRFRGEGWPGKLKIVTKTGDRVEMSYEESWGKHLGRSVQNRCKLCFDGIGESADVTFGDAWHLNKNFSIDFEEADGRNIIITRNSKGDQLLEEAVKLRLINIEMQLKNDDLLCKMQPYQYERRGLITTRYSAFRIFLLPKLSYPKNVFKEYSTHFSFRQKIRHFSGTSRRILKALYLRNDSRGKSNL